MKKTTKAATAAKVASNAAKATTEKAANKAAATKAAKYVQSKAAKDTEKAIEKILADNRKAAAKDKAAATDKMQYSIVYGRKAAKVADDVEKFLARAIAATEAANKGDISTLQVSYSTLIKEFGVWNDKEFTLSAASMDIFAIWQKACYNIASRRHAADAAARIPLLKLKNKDNAAAACLVTVKGEFFDTVYAANLAADKAKEKAAATKAANDKAKADKAAKEKADNDAATAADVIDNADKATAAIMQLIATYGSRLDLPTITAAIEKAKANAATAKAAAKKAKAKAAANLAAAAIIA